MQQPPNRPFSTTTTLCALLLACALLGAGGCSSVTVTPPSDPIDPVTVYVADYGIHSSILLPAGDGRLVEYAFGDYGYSVKEKPNTIDGFGAAFVSMGASLGRRYVDDPGPGKTIDNLKNGPDQTAKVTPVVVSGAKARKLLEEFDRRFADGGEPRFNAVNGMNYVRARQGYSLFHNCNHMTMWSLNQLDCKVGGLVVTTDFKVRQPGGAAGDGGASPEVRTPSEPPPPAAATPAVAKGPPPADDTMSRTAQLAETSPRGKAPRRPAAGTASTSSTWTIRDKQQAKRLAEEEPAKPAAPRVAAKSKSGGSAKAKSDVKSSAKKATAKGNARPKAGRAKAAKTASADAARKSSAAKAKGSSASAKIGDHSTAEKTRKTQAAEKSESERPAARADSRTPSRRRTSHSTPASRAASDD